MFRHKSLIKSFLMVAGATVTLPLLYFLFIQPMFVDYLVEEKEHDAVLLGRHLSALAAPGLSGPEEQWRIPGDFLDEIGRIQEDFQLYKVRIFSRTGRILFSTHPPEIGEINEHDYFHHIVATGRVFSKAVTKSQPTMEGEVIQLDVVETYIPIMGRVGGEERFVGAFEIYWDYTDALMRLKQRILLASTITFAIALILLGLSIFALKREGRVLSAKLVADRQLREKEARLSATLTTALDSIVTLDAKGRILDCNPSTLRLFGFALDRIRGQSIFDTIVPLETDERAKWEASLQLLTREGPILDHRIDIEGRCADGSRVDLELTASAIKSLPQPLFTAFFRDITDRKQMLESLREALTAAQEASRAKSAFLAAMSHDIRTPMNAILGVAELLRESDLSEEQAEYVRMFSSAGETLLALINDILDLSKIEAGQLQLEAAPLDLPALVGSVVDIFVESARKKGLSLTWRMAPDLPRQLIGDELRLRQILFNLVGNAIKFTETGEVAIDVKRAIRPNEERSLLFAVSDTGIGVPLERQGEIFAPFTQAENSTSRRFGGTGLGLAICTRLAELMEGRIGVKSVPGQGSTFYFTARLGVTTAGSAAFLKSGGQTRPREIVEMDERRATVRPLRILLVDDSEDSRLLIQAFLKNEPHRIVTAENGQQALILLKEQTFDLVFMDMQMPEMDGYTATTLYREWERQQGDKTPAPIIALTAHAMKEDTDKILEAGCDLHLTKPIKKQRLLEVLKGFG